VPMVFCNQCQYCTSAQQNFCPHFTVLGRGVDGGNCELIAVPRVNVVPIPDTLTYEQAASVPLVFLTAWHMLVGRAQMKVGQSVLVLGAGSGVGSAAIQICKLFNATVITTAGDERKLEKARELGADYTINHYKQKIADEVKRITSKQGVDIVFEHVGEATWEKSIRSLAVGGRLVTCGATTGFEGKIDIRYLFTRQLSILGSYMGGKAELLSVLELVRRDALKPVIDKIFPLEQAAQAHKRLESREQFGKVVLRVP